MNAPFCGDNPTEVTLIRVQRRPMQPKSENVRFYKLLSRLVPTLDVWVELPSGWTTLTAAGLTRENLHELWLEEEAEIQERTRGGWEDVFTLTR